jgi:hypothetical protein
MREEGGGGSGTRWWRGRLRFPLFSLGGERRWSFYSCFSNLHDKFALPSYLLCVIAKIAIVYALINPCQMSL